MSPLHQHGLIPQAGAIPYRQSDQGTEFCLITSSSGGHWGFPKGIIEPGDTPQETALQEAWEEAGLHGRIVGEPLGLYHYEKWDSELEVTMYLMEVERAAANWPESGVRKRAWLLSDEALDRLDRPALRQLLATAIKKLA